MLRVCVAQAVLGAGVSPLQAAGGHHAVDDAAMLESGQCQIETWADRERGGARSLLHVGPACRAGPVELGLGLDRVRQMGARTVSTIAPQIKWAFSLGERWHAGLSLAATWQDAAPRYLGGTVVIPVTWQAGETLAFHINAGRDLRARAADDTRSGAALEWAPLPAWSFVAERFRESRANQWRVAARWTPGPAWTFDLGRARRLDEGGATWTLGAKVTLGQGER